MKNYVELVGTRKDTHAACFQKVHRIIGSRGDW